MLNDPLNYQLCILKDIENLGQISKVICNMLAKALLIVSLCAWPLR